MVTLTQLKTDVDTVNTDLTNGSIVASDVRNPASPAGLRASLVSLYTNIGFLLHDAGLAPLPQPVSPVV